MTGFVNADTPSTAASLVSRQEHSLPRTLESVDLTGVRASILAADGSAAERRGADGVAHRVGGKRLVDFGRAPDSPEDRRSTRHGRPVDREPLYDDLGEYDRTGSCPASIDPREGITLLETNARFVTSFLVGANHEMNPSCSGAAYPTDRRGTTLRALLGLAR